MSAETDRHHRRSIRLPGYDYSQPGAYFVTLVTQHRELLFENEAYRNAVEVSWQLLGALNAHVLLDVHVVMPNHFHGIVFLTEPRRGGSRTAPTDATITRKPLGRLIGAFKTTSSKAINIARTSPGTPVWQRNYYERVIRDDAELNRVRQYILDNPANWPTDPENPAAQ